MRTALLALLLLAPFVPLMRQSSAPELQSVMPNGAQAGSSTVTITVTGTGFNSSSVVRVGDESMPTTFVGANTLRSVVPDNRLKVSDVLLIAVSNTDTGRSSSSLGFSVFSFSPPTGTSIEPSAGLRNSSLEVSVRGTNLAGAAVSFSGTGISASTQQGSTTFVRVLIAISSDAPFGQRTMTISTPAGSTSRCGEKPCTFSVVDSGSWTPAGLLNDVRRGAAVVKLLDGRILIAGGSATVGEVTRSAETLDPATGQWTPTGSLSLARRSAAATLLPDGRVLLAGGNDGSATLSSVEIYDPASGRWSTAGFMSIRGANGAVLLTDGRVLSFFSSTAAVVGEFFDPVSGRFQLAEGGAYSAANASPTAYSLLSDGRVLISASAMASRIYDPSTSTLSNVVAMPSANTGAWSRLLPDTRVLIRVSNVLFGRSVINQTFAFLYDPVTNSAFDAAPIAGSDVLLPSGLVLISGTLYDPSNDQRIPVPPMSRQLSAFSSVLLDDGRAVVIGTSSNAGSSRDVFAEIYSPGSYTNPAPAVLSVSSNTPASNVDVVRVDIRGTGFLPNSIVRVESTKLVTLYLGSQRLAAFVPPSLRGTLNSVGVAVVNPAPGGGSTGRIPVGFVTIPAPSITSAIPATANPGSQFAMIVSGQNLGSPLSVNFNGGGVNSTIQSGSSSSLTLNVTVDSDAPLGIRALTVTTAGGSVALANALRIQTTSPPVTVPLPISEVETGAVRTGYVVITQESGRFAPIATLTYGIVRNGAVQSQAAILPTSPVTETSVLLNIVPAIGRNLGIAIANTSGTAASIVIAAQDEDGTALGFPVTLAIADKQQLARFVTELLPSSTIGAGFRGSLRIRSSMPVSIVGLRFSGTEFSTAPLPSIGGSTVPANIVFPQFAMSGGWATTVGLANIYAFPVIGRVDFFDPAGNPLSVELNGTKGSSFPYNIPPGGSLTLAPRDSNGQSPF